MKRFVLSVLTLMCSLLAISQNQFGFFAGPQATTVHYTVAGQKQKNDFKYGFQAGAMMKIPIEGSLYFAPEAFYSMKGYKVTLSQYAFPPDVNARDNNTTLHTFELGILVQCDLGKGPGNFYLKGGPSLDFQLFGHEEYNLANGNNVSRKMKFSYGDYGRYSVNMLAQLGYETSGGLIIFGQYSHGLSSINNADGGPQIKHRVYGISIGKYLNKKKIVMDTRNKE